MGAATPWWCKWLRLFYLSPPLALASTRKDLSGLKMAAAGLDILPNSWCTIPSCSEFWPVIARAATFSKELASIKASHMAQGCLEVNPSSPPSSPPPPDCSKVAQQCHTSCAPSSGWNQAEANFNCNYIFVWHLAHSWPSYLISLFNKSRDLLTSFPFSKNLSLRFFLAGAETMFLRMSSFPHLFFWVPI